jgi:hypothetical protein
MFRVPKDRENIGHKRFFIQKKKKIYIYINNIYKNNIYFIYNILKLYIKIIYIYIYILFIYIYIKNSQNKCKKR